MDFLARPPVVIDNGTGVIKAGFAGEDRPRALLASVVGRPKHVRVMAGGALEGSAFVGEKVEEHRGALMLSRPLERGRVTNWEDTEVLWSHIFGGAAVAAAAGGGEGGGGVDRGRLPALATEHPVLLSEPALASKAAREAAAEAMFESLHVPALFLAPAPVLALYATGRTTGTVLDCGEGLTSATPVYEGYAVPHATVVSEVGGRDVTERLLALLRRSGAPLGHSSADVETARVIKEAACHAALSPAEEEAAARDGALAPCEYRLPDGQALSLGAERFRAAEVLFAPAVIGREEPGAGACAAQAIMRCDLDMRRTLQANTVLCGGSTALRNFPQRLLSDLRRALPAGAKVRLWAPADRKLLPWIGGSILASLGTFRSMWLTRAAWEEEGPALLHRAALG